MASDTLRRSIHRFARKEARGLLPCEAVYEQRQDVHYQYKEAYLYANDEDTEQSRRPRAAVTLAEVER